MTAAIIVLASPLLVLAGGSSDPDAAGLRCRTPQVEVRLDFEGAGGRCRVLADDRIEIRIAPEHAPPINPSPWYAFRYRLTGSAPASVTLRYAHGRHRYPPKVSRDGRTWRVVPVPAQEGGAPGRLEFRLPPGGRFIAAQELVSVRDASRRLRDLARRYRARVEIIGRSHGGRPIEALIAGRASGRDYILLLGRQHPPEVSGAIAFEAFLAALLAAQHQSGARAHPIVAVPMLNPDGVAAGHWRSNGRFIDINRDWGRFSEPETRAVSRLIDRRCASDRAAPVLMVDFHATQDNLFYVQTEAEAPAVARWTRAWLASATQGGGFRLEPRPSDTGNGSAKNYFHTRFGIASITFEAADEADRAALRTTAQSLAAALPHQPRPPGWRGCGA